MCENTTERLDKFREYLNKKGLSQNTITSYVSSARLYFSLYPELNIENLQKYKQYLIGHFRPNTVNSRIHGMNQYIVSVSFQAALEPYHLSTIKHQQRPFLDNIISKRNYERFKRCLKNDNNMFWYFVVRFLGATGARVSELIQIKVEHVRIGFLDLYSKGGKLRRIYFPERLCLEMLAWLTAQGKESGFIFVNSNGQQISARGIRGQLKTLAKRYRIAPETVYPHSFRHRFAKNFLNKFNDISLLADLMGHESIETTRIYLTQSSKEQSRLIDRIVTW